jgi:hypothetical protein
MNRALALDTQKKPAVTLARIPTLVPQRRFDVPEGEQSAVSNQRDASAQHSAVSGQQAEHDFGSLSLGSETAEVRSQSCPLATPRTCPFGGACHTCPTRVQAKLEVGRPNDEYEREADRVAEQVMRMPEPAESSVVSGQRSGASNQQSAISSQLPSISRAPAGTTGIEVSPEVESRIRSLRGGGRPLSDPDRAFFEPRFGHDFSKIRIHSDGRAADAARAVDARAFTVGQEVVLGAGQCTHGSEAGSKLMAHELAHVGQQNRPLGSTPHLVQRWKLGVHEDLTKAGLTKMGWAGLNGALKDDLYDYSNDMDLRSGDATFNTVAVSLAKISRAAMVKWYLNNKATAKNHGEGGCYEEENKSAAAGVNVEHQNSFVAAAARATSTLEVLKQIGNALHVAQDRGAHGEGAKGEGHDRSDGITTDDPGSDTAGYKAAENNTEVVLKAVGKTLASANVKAQNRWVQAALIFDHLTPHAD